jgi:hypothetical protein
MTLDIPMLIAKKNKKLRSSGRGILYITLLSSHSNEKAINARVYLELGLDFRFLNW